MIGDSDDIFARLKSILPRWFGQDTGETPILDGVLRGPAWALALVYSLYSYAVLQTRIRTATGGWLDLIAQDFFGRALRRLQNQKDDSFRARIIANLFRERGTRRAVEQVLLDLTGRLPIIIEPWRPADIGAYRSSRCGYGMAGRYGSHSMPFQAFIIAYRPHGAGVPLVAGYRTSVGGLRTHSRAVYVAADAIHGEITDDDIFAAIASVKPAGTTLWVHIAP